MDRRRALKLMISTVSIMVSPALMGINLNNNPMKKDSIDPKVSSNKKGH